MLLPWLVPPAGCGRLKRVPRLLTRRRGAAMDLSLWSSFPRLLVFYSVLLTLVCPALHLVDRVILRVKRARRGA